jgi:hypothetical protein
MANIELTSQQIEELKSFYTAELERIQARTAEIKGLLEQLKEKGERVPAAARKQVREKAPKKIARKEHKEGAGQKEAEGKGPRWTSFILDTLQEIQKPLSRKEIARLYDQQHHTRIASSKNAMAAIAQALFWLRVKNKKIQSLGAQGKREKLYGLTEWPAEVYETALASMPVKKIKEKKARKPRKPRAAAKPKVKVALHPAIDWLNFIKETLIKTRRVMTANEILRYAVSNFQIPDFQVKPTRSNLLSTLSKLGKNPENFKTVQKENVRGKSYGLPEWFNEDGQLIPEFK